MDNCGNEICIGIDGESYGKIYFFDRETGNDYLIANSFERFVNSFRSKEEFAALQSKARR